jgi:hypothetical protein
MEQEMRDQRHDQWPGSLDHRGDAGGGGAQSKSGQYVRNPSLDRAKRDRRAPFIAPRPGPAAGEHEEAADRQRRDRGARRRQRKRRKHAIEPLDEDEAARP